MALVASNWLTTSLNYGATVAGASAIVPEPATLVQLLFGLFLLTIVTRACDAGHL